MNLRTASAALSTVFAEKLGVYGFAEAGRLTFTRGSNLRSEVISFSIRRDRSGAFCFGIGVGIRFAAIENELPPRPAGQELFATVGMPLHLLLMDRRYREWCFTDEQLEIAEPLRLIEEYGLAFFNTYASLEDVHRTLSSSDPMDWFTLSPNRRRALLDAIERALSNE